MHGGGLPALEERPAKPQASQPTTRPFNQLTKPPNPTRPPACPPTTHPPTHPPIHPPTCPPTHLPTRPPARPPTSNQPTHSPTHPPTQLPTFQVQNLQNFQWDEEEVTRKLDRWGASPRHSAARGGPPFLHFTCPLFSAFSPQRSSVGFTVQPTKRPLPNPRKCPFSPTTTKRHPTNQTNGPADQPTNQPNNKQTAQPPTHPTQNARYMTDAFEEVHKVSKDRGVPLRVAAYMLAVQRVASAECHRGFGA